VVPGSRAETLTTPISRLPRSVALDPSCRLKVPASTGAGSARPCMKFARNLPWNIAVGGRDNPRGLHCQSLHRHKPGAGAPVAGAVSTTEPRASEGCAGGCKGGRPSHPKATRNISGLANIPEPGVKAKVSREKATSRNRQPEKPAEKSLTNLRKPRAFPPRRAVTSPRRAKRRFQVCSGAVQPSAPFPAPNMPRQFRQLRRNAPEERRDANELAVRHRALRGAGDGSPRAQEPLASRMRLASRTRPVLCRPPPVAARTVRPLPPPIMVSRPQLRRSIRPPDRHR